VIQGLGGGVDFPVKSFGIGERLMGQMMCLEVVPSNLNVVEFGRVLGEPVDSQPVLARIESLQLATGVSGSGAQTLSAASVFTGGAPA